MALLEELPRLCSGHHGEGCRLPGVGFLSLGCGPTLGGQCGDSSLAFLTSQIGGPVES